MDNKIKFFIECLIPITSCNLKCHYCYVIQRHQREMRKAELKYPIETIIRGLSRERFGGIGYISICGAGETLIQPEMPELILGLLKEGHYVNITTNGTITHAFERIKSIIEPELLRHLVFSLSFHYLELKRLGWLDRFFDNYRMLREMGCSVLVQLNLCDEYIACFDEIKQLCMEKIGALPQIAATRKEINLRNNVELFTKLTKKEYVLEGSKYDSPLFDFTMKNFMVKRREFCYAGQWTYTLDLSTGFLKPCYASQLRQNIFKDIESPIKFTAIGCHCRSPFCMNSSHFMSLGVIPSIITPSYVDLRNRICKDGTEWYNEDAKLFLSGKLENTNHLEVSNWKMFKQNSLDTFANIANRLVTPSIKKKIKNWVS